MQEGKIMHFNSIDELQMFLASDLDELKKKSEEYSKLIGLKLRDDKVDNTAEFAELKEKLEGPDDPKKKKVVKKKDKKTNWHTMGSILVFDGIGAKGELELYFKALEALKVKIDSIQKAKESIDDLISKGIKKELGAAALLNDDLSFEMVFLKMSAPKTKFAYKAIITVGAEQMNEIKI